MAAAILLVAAAATACSGGGGGGGQGDESGPLTSQKLSWTRCPAASDLQGSDAGKPQPLPDGTQWECSTLKVPLNWSKPNGKRIDLALVRAKAKDQKHRIGSLVFNFGGPGGSGVSTLPGAAQQDYQKLHTRYDLVSFDPRGVGNSDGVRCLSNKALDAANAMDATPDNAAERKASLAQTQRTAQGCKQNSGQLLPYVDTASAARDMDLMRQVLGDRKLNYFGISYGTELGAVYAHLFPQHVGRTVFDAVVDPTQDPEQSALGQAKGFQLALGNFLKDCAKSGASCPTGTDPAQGEQRIKDLLNQLDTHPLPAQNGRKLTQSLALNGIAQALYSKDYWQYLKQGLSETQQLHTGNVLLTLSDAMTGRDQQGDYSNITAANAAVVCRDSKQRYTEGDVQAKQPEFGKASPVFGDFLAWGLLQCTDWPVAGKSNTLDVSAKGSGPIVVVGNTGDPATPFAGAHRMALALGKGVGVEVVNKGQGHGAYGSGGCVTNTVNDYLLNGQVPPNGKTCTP